ncbi:glutathione S-transferase family protein [Aestuariivirga litoralis]|uniref:glutathione S-transferase family protein n=1 Tax=Aestuariivirga litoralis TaxID=2650924 RepID=UPI0018C47393|nr:glutathione S-transferase family protein [Aestuariivirga litoralis]MBG1232708.1 glutathione S-transferase family protein [Aestuariivirga litoralis]
MSKILYFSRNPNPRLAVAVARYLQAPVSLEFASTFAPAHEAKFKALNPTQLLPILVEDGHSLWEADAIACRLSMMVGSNFWRMDAETPEMIRWISWAKANFVWACDIVHFEFGTKQRYGFGPVEHDKVKEGEALFHKAARILDDHLKNREWLMDSGISYADFRMATFLPFNDVAGLPLADYPNLSRWNDGLMRLPGWADPFEGLQAPELHPVPKR